MSTDFYQTYILPYSSIIIKICRAYSDSKEDFEDFYQEACLQIWNSRDNFREGSQWSTWIYRITLNVCLSLLRKNKTTKTKTILKESLAEYTEQTDSSQSDMDNRSDILRLYDAIKRLSEIDRAIIILHLEENSYKEIASIIGTNTNSIGVKITRIKKRLKKHLNG